MTAKPQVSPKTHVEGSGAKYPPSAGFASNTVLGLPERVFRMMWVRDLVTKMVKSGRGLRRHSHRHTGRTYWAGDDFATDRRGDKLGPRDPKWLRSLRSNTVEK